MMDTDILLSNIYIQGEISNLKFHYSGHMYFTLKDESSVIKAVMFKNKIQQLSFIPQNGMKVIVRGYISVYEASGQYQIYADNMKQQGTGDLYVAFEKLKEKLEEDIFYYRQENIADPIMNLVSFMNVDEMTKLAETLVNLTSLKQQFSMNSKETVGGPVDIAFVSKENGFEWIYRKAHVGGNR
jgi:RecJ-like exonuclease